MSPAEQIRQAIGTVTQLRQVARAEPWVATAVGAVKHFQSRRFCGTYADMLAGGPYQAPALFFLEELYSERDFEERDAQFMRIAGSIEKLFPAKVGELAVALAQLHALTEELDQQMGAAWASSALRPESARYADAWRKVGRRPDRRHQLEVVLAVGDQLSRLTRTPGLRTMLRMMRGPASAAGFQALQTFLERGFDTFGGLAKDPQAVRDFMGAIAERESALIDMLFDDELVSCETRLAAILGQAR